jgi:hypothetical protein
MGAHQCSTVNAWRMCGIHEMPLLQNALDVSASWDIKRLMHGIGSPNVKILNEITVHDTVLLQGAAAMLCDQGCNFKKQTSQ